MKRRQIEKMLRSGMRESAPDVLDRVMAHPRGETPPRETRVKPPRQRIARWVPALAACLAVVAAVTGVLAHFAGKDSPTTPVTAWNGSLYLDINPSVQFLLDERGRVTAVTPLNADARVILAGREGKLKGLSCEEAAELVVEYAAECGYIKVSKRNNAVLVSASLEVSENEKPLEKKVGGEIAKKFTQKGIYGVVVTDPVKTDVSAEAERLGITESKLRLIVSLEELGVSFTDAEKKSVSVSALYERLEEAAGEFEEKYDEEKLEKELEKLEERTEKQLERMAEDIDRLAERLEKYIEKVLEDSDEELAERLQDAVDDLNEAFEELTDGDSQSAEADLARVAELTQKLTGITVEDPQIAGMIDELTARIDENVAGFGALNAQLAEARQLFEEQRRRFEAYGREYGSHTKPDDFDDYYEDWLEETQERYENDWEAMKRAWEAEDD